MNEFDWIKDEVKASQVTHWTEYHLREFLNNNVGITVDVFKRSYGFYRGKWKLYKIGKRYFIERKVIRCNYNDGWKTYDSVIKETYKIGQVVDYLNKKEWVIN
jgi:hypothetical protein